MQQPNGSQTGPIQAPCSTTALPATGQLEEAGQRQQEAALVAARSAHSDAHATTARLERQLAVMGKERDGLKRILASYQQDDARAPACPSVCANIVFPTNDQRAASRDKNHGGAHFLGIAPPILGAFWAQWVNTRCLLQVQTQALGLQSATP